MAAASREFGSETFCGEYASASSQKTSGISARCQKPLEYLARRIGKHADARLLRFVNGTQQVARLVNCVRIGKKQPRAPCGL